MWMENLQSVNKMSAEFDKLLSGLIHGCFFNGLNISTISTCEP